MKSRVAYWRLAEEGSEPSKRSFLPMKRMILASMPSGAMKSYTWWTPAPGSDKVFRFHYSKSRAGESAINKNRVGQTSKYDIAVIKIREKIGAN